MKKFSQKEYIGKTYGKLTILNFENTKVYEKKNNKLRNIFKVTCQCFCGNLWTGKLGSIKSKNTISCGCHRKENPVRKTHGLRKTSEYEIWAAMKARCLNPKNKAYHNYGGRGITVCKEWLNSFKTFIFDMGFRPSKEYSLERIDNNLGYYKQNCKWATIEEQSNNRRTNKLYFYLNKQQTLVNWAKEYNIDYSNLYRKINRNKWSLEKTLNYLLKIQHYV